MLNKTSLTPPLIQQALDRDRQCIFSGFVPSCDAASGSNMDISPILGLREDGYYGPMAKEHNLSRSRSRSK